MPARCHSDSCSIAWEEINEGGLKYQASVVLDPDGGLVCTDGQGLGVLVSGAAGNIISGGVAGLFASLPASAVSSLSGNPANQPVGPGADSGSPQSSDTYVYENTSGRDGLVIVSGEFNFNYGILGPTHAFSYSSGTGVRAGRIAAASYDATGAGAAGDDTAGAQLVPYNAQLAMRLLADIDTAPVTSRKAVRQPVGGLINVSSPASAELQTVRFPFFYMHRVPAGGELRMKSQAFYEGPSQTVNVVATPSAGTGLAGTGHELWNLQAATIPI